jgi:hypothetical protein
MFSFFTGKSISHDTKVLKTVASSNKLKDEEVPVVRSSFLEVDENSLAARGEVNAEIHKHY